MSVALLLFTFVYFWTSVRFDIFTEDWNYHITKPLNYPVQNVSLSVELIQFYLVVFVYEYIFIGLQSCLKYK